MNKEIDYIIVGAQKAATTSLFQLLKRHPEIDGHEHREFSFFLTEEFGKGIDYAMEKYFPRQRDGTTITLAKHALLMYSEEGLKRLKDQFPEVKIIVILRDPVKRAHSSFLYARSLGREPIENFEDAILREKERIEQDGWEEWKNNAYILNSRYDIHLDNIYSLYSSDQVFPYILENYANITDLADKLLHDLGLSTYRFEVDEYKTNKTKQARSLIVAKIINAFVRNDNVLKKVLRFLFPHKSLMKIRNFVIDSNLKQMDKKQLNDQTEKKLQNYLCDAKKDLSHKYSLDVEQWG